MFAPIVATSFFVGCEARTSNVSPPPPTVASPAVAPVTTALRAPSDADIQSFITATYGSSASRQGNWTNAHHDTLRVCADGDVMQDGMAQRFIAVCTTLKTPESSRDGRIDLFALASKGTGVAPAAEARALAFRFNNGPAQVKIVRSGQARHVFEIQSQVLDEYGTALQRTWYVARDGVFAEAMTLPAQYTADGTAWCRYADTTTCEGSTTELAYDVHVDMRDPQRDVYPLTVLTHGIRCDAPIATTSTPITFGAATRTYRVPTTLRFPTTDCRPGVAQPPSSLQD